MKFSATTISLFIALSFGSPCGVFAEALASSEAKQKAEMVEVLCFDYPPLVVSGSNGSGFLVELVRAGFKKAGIKAQFRFLPAKRAFHVFSKTGGLLLASQGLTSKNYDFLKMMRMQGGLFGHTKFKEVKKTAVLRALQFGLEAAKELELNQLPVSGYNSASKAYLAGRVQAIMGMELPIRYLSYTKYPELKDLKTLMKPVFTDFAGVSASPKGKGKLRALLKGLKRLEGSQELSELTKRSFSWDKSGMLIKEVLESFEIDPNHSKKVLQI